jgi:hypothetical protein
MSNDEQEQLSDEGPKDRAVLFLSICASWVLVGLVGLAIYRFFL